MPAPDSLALLAEDLRALPGARRRAIMRALSAGERERLTSLLETASAPAASRSADEDEFASFSAWLGARLREAKGGADAPRGSWKMTAAARQHLLSAAREATGADRSAGRPRAGRSLLGVFGGLLAPRSARP